MKRTFLHLHQEQRSKPFLLLEIGMLGLRLHSIDARQRPIRIALLREESLVSSSTQALLEKARSILDGIFPIRDLAIVMNSPAIRHQIICIPLLSAAERQKILLNEMKYSSASEEAPAITTFWSAGKMKDKATLKEYVLCAQLPRSIADGLIAVIRRKNFNLLGFTSHAQMVSHILKEHPLDGGRNIAMIEVNEREGSVSLFRSNIWNMDRHFLIGRSGAPYEARIPPHLDSEKLKLEVGRALQYFKQQVRNENIDHIFEL